MHPGVIVAVCMLSSATLVAGQCPQVPGDCLVTLLNPQETYANKERADYECITGYRVVGANDNDVTTGQLRCRKTGTWALLPRIDCEKKVCGTPPDGTGTVPVPTSVSLEYEDSYVYSCQTGYEPASLGMNMVTECDENGDFTLTVLPVCVVRTCPPVPDGINTVPVTADLELDYTQSYQYECLEGYTTTDPLCTVCLEDSTFSNPAPNCTRITCDGPEDALNIKPIPASIADGMDFEQTYTYECAEGYSTDDPLCVVCQSNGSLSIGAPTCSEITCPAPNRGANSKKPPSDIRDGMTYLETYTYECKKGFTTDVEDRCTVCLPNGTLSLPDGPDCAAITCDSPGNGTNTVPIPPNIADGMTYLESYTYSCMEGYSTNDPLCVVCQPDSTLSISPPVCTAITCPGLMNGTNTIPVPDNLAVSVEYLMSYTYSCEEGYYTNDTVCVVCEPNGELSGPPPVCAPITCEGLTDGVGTEPVPNEFRLGMKYLQQYTYSCQEGFSTNEDLTVICQPDGSLSTTDPPICTRILCQGPPEGVNIKEIPSNIADGLSYLELYEYSCLPGYETNDSLCVFCQPDSMLSLSKGPNCTEIPVDVTCVLPQGGDNTVPVPVDLTIVAGTSFTYQCQSGFSTTDETSLSCLGDGSLFPMSPPNCSAIVCPPLIPGQNTVDVPTTPLKFLETYTYTCEPGYSTNDPLCVLCNADGEFSIDPPNCTAVICGSVPAGINVYDVPKEPLKAGDMYTYTCLEGYFTNDKTSVQCQQNGELSLEKGPNCTKIVCGKPEEGTNTELVCPDLSLESLDAYVYTCMPGYNTMDETCTVCLPNGEFSLEMPPNCTEIICTGLPESDTTLPVPEEKKLGLRHLETYSYSCIEGYRTDDELCAVCQADGSFSLEVAPNCTAITCEGLDDGNNTVPVPKMLRESTQYLQSYIYQCIDGYSTNDDLFVFCQPDGELSGPPPECRETYCKALENGTNTVPIPEDFRLLSLQTFLYECLEGYTTSDELVVLCRPDGELSDEPPTCIERQCDGPPNGINTVPPPSDPQPVLSNYEYECLDGYVFTPEYVDNYNTVCEPTYEWSLMPPPVCTRECELELDALDITIYVGVVPGTDCTQFYYYPEDDPETILEGSCDSGESLNVSDCRCERDAECEVP